MKVKLIIQITNLDINEVLTVVQINVIIITGILQNGNDESRL